MLPAIPAMPAIIVAAESPLDHIVRHPIIQRPADLGILTPEGRITLLDNHIAMTILAGLVLILFLPALVKKRRSRDAVGALVPSGFGNFVEMVCQFLRKEVAEPQLGAHTDRFIKYIWSVFFLILTINVLGLLPIAPLAGLFGSHLGGTATSNIWVTGTFAVTTLVMMVFNGLRFGGKAYIAHFCPGPLWLAPLLVPVEIVGLGARIFALAIRLFSNMVAGHVLLAVLLSFILSAGSSMGAAGGLAVAVPVVLASVAITMLEIFVAFLQAFIFTFLTTVFLGASVNVHHGEHADHGDEHAHGPAAAH
jgi:F-type H+-transporting ATPase subunit a